MAVYKETDGDILREYALDLEEENLFQQVTQRGILEIVPTKQFGKAVFIDNVLQLTEKDEYIYHEALVHPCMSLIPKKSNVCIIGGGDGCAAREVLRWEPEVKSIDLIDWDEDVTQIFKNNYFSMNKGSLQSSIVSIENCDIRDCLEDDRTYDVIIVDLLDPDPLEHYQIDLWYDILFMAKHWLTEYGSIVINAGGCTPWNTQNLQWLMEIMERKCRWPIRLYKTFVPSFGREWCFILMTQVESKEIHELPEGLRFLNNTIWKQMCSFSNDYCEQFLGLNILRDEEEDE